jgi:hypothetical protein
VLRGAQSPRPLFGIKEALETQFLDSYTVDARACG